MTYDTAYYTRGEAGAMLAPASRAGRAAAYVDRWVRVGVRLGGFPAVIRLEHERLPNGKAFTREHIERFKDRLRVAEAMVRDGSADGLDAEAALRALDVRMRREAAGGACVESGMESAGRVRRIGSGGRRYPPLRLAAAGAGVKAGA